MEPHLRIGRATADTAQQIDHMLDFGRTSDPRMRLHGQAKRAGRCDRARRGVPQQAARAGLQTDARGHGLGPGHELRGRAAHRRPRASAAGLRGPRMEQQAARRAGDRIHLQTKSHSGRRRLMPRGPEHPPHFGRCRFKPPKLQLLAQWRQRLGRQHHRQGQHDQGFEKSRADPARRLGSVPAQTFPACSTPCHRRRAAHSHGGTLGREGLPCIALSGHALGGCGRVAKAPRAQMSRMICRNSSTSSKLR